MQIQYELLRTTSHTNFTSKEDDRRQHFEKCYAGPEIVTHRSQSNTIRRMLRNTRQSWILDPIPWIVDSGCWIPVFFSGTWILDSMPQWDFGVLQLYSGFQSPGFRLPRAKFSRILHSTSKEFPRFQNPDTLRWGEVLVKHFRTCSPILI